MLHITEQHAKVMEQIAGMPERDLASSTQLTSFQQLTSLLNEELPAQLQYQEQRHSEALEEKKKLCQRHVQLTCEISELEKSLQHHSRKINDIKDETLPQTYQNIRLLESKTLSNLSSDISNDEMCNEMVVKKLKVLIIRNVEI